jgi:CRISPR-associated protein Cas1
MIKRTLYFGNPAYLSTENKLLKIELQGSDAVTVPMEDLGVVILDHPQITISHVCIARLLDNNTALITCNDKHMPVGLMLNLDGHTLQSKKFQAQLEAGLPLKKQLWQQTVRSKILNQSLLLEKKGKESATLIQLAKNVKSGDTGNAEGLAAQYYWPRLVGGDFLRGRYDGGLNTFLNYGYAILRAVVARSLVGAGMIPTLGIFHRNQYNAYCLADDIMEPYRPFVDEMVISHKIFQDNIDLNTETKKILLSIPTLDVSMEGRSSPLMVAVQRTCASLAKCFAGEEKQLLYPVLHGYA